MIYDIIKLPMRIPEYTEISSIVPVFHALPGIEDVSLFGRIYQVPTLFKYKTIEISGQNTIERILVTDEDIDISKSWWTNKSHVIPVSFKIFDWTKSTYHTYKYRNGLEEMLSNTCWDCISKTIHLETLNTAKKVLLDNDQFYTAAKLDNITYNKNHPVHKLISGDDRKNISNLTMLRNYEYQGIDTTDLQAQYVDIFPSTWLPNLDFKDFGNVLCMHNDLTWKDLGKTKVSHYGNLMCSALVSNYKTPFDPLGQDVAYYDANEHTRWMFQDFVNYIEQLCYTDVYIEIDFIKSNKPETKTEFYSRYLGHTNLETYDKCFNRIKQETLFLFEQWISQFVKMCPCKIVLQKNWLEEIFIEIKFNRRTIKFYVDLVMYSMGSPSLVEIE